MVVNSSYFFGGIVCFPSLSCAGRGLSDVCVIMGVVGFLGLRFSF